MKLKNQLSFGFGTVTLLLIVLSTISFFKFNDVDKEFDNYRALAIASMSTGGVQASILETILAVDEYLEHPTQENITPVNNRLSSSIQLINTMLLNATDPEDNVQLEQIKSNLVNYGASFQRVTNLLSLLQEEREQKSIPSGLAMQKITSKLTSLFRDNAEVSEILDELQEDVLLARLYEAKYTASNKISDAKKAENELSKIENVTSSLKNIEMGELPSQELIAFNRAFNTYKKAFNTNKRTIMSLHSIVNTELDTISELTSTAISNINDRTEVKQNKIGPQMVKGINNAKSFLLIISIISIVTAIGIALFIYKNISTIVGGEPTDIAKLVKKVAEGDISTHLSISGKETGIYKNIIEMRIELKRIIDGLHSSLDNVSSASVELAAVMVQTESNAQQELSQVEQIATAINELSSTATEVSQNASSAEHAANKAITNVDLGQSALTLSNDVSDKIETSIKETTEIVNQLREYSIEIGTVVEVINSISEQTNLLALNAAIEAARAGEQGRGFAVVADEVRSLAAKTQESTVDIQDIISRLQEQATKANDHMKGNISLVDSSKENSNKLHSAFVHITNSVTLISDMNTQVATASEEQSGVTQDISENVNLTFDLVNQNVTGIHQSKTASEELSSLAEQQKILLGFFKNS